MTDPELLEVDVDVLTVDRGGDPGLDLVVGHRQEADAVEVGAGRPAAAEPVGHLGQPGAAAWVLEGMRGDWRVSSGVAGTPQLDAVHRVLGRPGIVLVAEGSPQRVRPLIAQEKRRIAKVVGDTPIYDITVGDAEGQVPLKKLSSHVMKLPRNLDGAEVNSLGKRMNALGGARMPIPGGPMPGGKQMTVSQRQMRRR